MWRFVGSSIVNACWRYLLLMPFPFPLCWENTKRVLGGRVWKYSSSSTSVSSSNNRMMYLWFLEVWFNSSDLPDVINMINYPSLPFNFMKGKYVLCEWWKRLSREENIFFGEENIFSPCPVTAELQEARCRMINLRNKIHEIRLKTRELAALWVKAQAEYIREQFWNSRILQNYFNSSQWMDKCKFWICNCLLLHRYRHWGLMRADFPPQLRSNMI